MPISVVVPVRVRLDPSAFLADPDSVRAGVEQAAKRALDRARREVFEPRSGYARPELCEPVITFYGHGLASIDAGMRNAIDSSIREAIARAAAAARLDICAEQRNAAPEVVVPGETAAFDPERQTPAGTGYIVDSYGSDTRKPDQIALDKQGGGMPAPPPSHGRMVRLVVCGHSAEEIMAAAGPYLARVVRERLPGRYGSALSPIGVLFRSRIDGKSYLSIFRILVDGGELTFENRVLFSQAMEVHGFRNGAIAASSLGIEGDVFTIKELGSGVVERTDDLLRRVARYFEAKKPLDAVMERLKRPGGAVTTLQRRFATAYKAGGKELLYREYAAVMLAGFQDPVPCRLYEVEHGDSIVLLGGEAPAFKSLPIVLLLEDVEQQSDRASEARPLSPGGDATAPKEDEARCWGRTETAIYSVDGAEAEEIIIGPFECEPPVTQFGVLGEQMMATMGAVAEQLRMTDRGWDYAGAFAINAALVMHGRASLALDRAIGELAEIKPAPFGKGNAGDADVKVSNSPAMQLLRQLASVAPLLQRLDAQVLEAMGSAYLPDHWRKHVAEGWKLHYRELLMPLLNRAVSAIFAEACRVAMLQLLGASGAGIRWVQANFDPYFETIKDLLTGSIRRLSELRRMREHILQAEAGNFLGNIADPVSFVGSQLRAGKGKRRGAWDELKEGGSATVRVGYQYWRDAREWWREDKTDTIGRARRELAAREAVEGQIERQSDGSFHLIETRDGKRHEWTRAALEDAIKTYEGSAAMANPLVKHMTNLEGSVAAFRTEAGAKEYFRKLVTRMADGNAKAISETRADRMFAFHTAKISDAWTQPLANTAGVKMENIHHMAHEMIGESFGGSWIYDEGLKFLFRSEKGREEILPVLELVVTIGAFTLFAPLGYALSAAAAAVRYDTAAAHEALAAGLIDPDQVLSQAEAELEMFMSHFEIALLVIPEAGTITKKLIGSGGTLFRQGLRQGSRTVARQATTHLLEEFATALKGELLKSFVHQLVTAKLLEPVLQQVLGPVFAQLQSEAELESVPGGGEMLADQLRFLAEYGDVEIEMNPVERLEDRP